MTDNPTRSWYRFVPQLNSRWWTALLGLSLMANLLIAGLVLGTRYRGDDRIMGASAVQVFPRSFLRDMPRERRNELMGIVRRDMRGLRDMREGSSEQIRSHSPGDHGLCNRPRQPRRQNRYIGHRRHRKNDPRRTQIPRRSNQGKGFTGEGEEEELEKANLQPRRERRFRLQI
jgi:hypothetical protein